MLLIAMGGELKEMTTSLAGRRFADRLTSRRGSWVALGMALLILLGVFGALRTDDAPPVNAAAPEDSESTQVSELMQKFPNADLQSVLVVASREDGGSFTDQQVTELEDLLPVLGNHADADSSGPLVSEDGEAALIITSIKVSDSNSEAAGIIEELRSDIDAHTLEGVELQVTGGPAFGADVASSFDGADFTLLLVTIIIVAVLLIATYRSPILWLIPLIVVALADGLAGRVTATAGALCQAPGFVEGLLLVDQAA